MTTLYVHLYRVPKGEYKGEYEIVISKSQDLSEQHLIVDSCAYLQNKRAAKEKANALKQEYEGMGFDLVNWNF